MLKRFITFTLDLSILLFSFTCLFKIKNIIKLNFTPILD